MMLRAVQVSVIVAAAVTGSVTAAVAQDRKWEVEVHGGGTVATNPTGGTAALPAAGTPYTVILNPANPASARSSRHVPSWYFGDGAVLLNDVNTSFGAGTPKITSLDGVVNAAMVERQNGGSFGVRIGRQITQRFTAEFSVDYGLGRLAMNDSALAGIEASRATFIPAFAARIADRYSPTSTAAIDDRKGRQIITTGALNINLKTTGKVVPYATVGGGVLATTGGAPLATLIGNYQLAGGTVSAPGPVFVSETDTVTLRYSIDRRSFVGVLGGGIRYAVTARWGVRLDVRAFLAGNAAVNRVEARPSVATLTPAVTAGTPTTPSMIWSNNPSTGVQSSLNGALDGFETFRGSGMQTQISIVPGFFWRF